MAGRQAAAVVAAEVQVHALQVAAEAQVPAPVHALQAVAEVLIQGHPAAVRFNDLQEVLV